MSRAFKGQFLYLLVMLLAIGWLVSDQSDQHEAFIDVLEELPFMGRMLSVAVKIFNAKQDAFSITVRSIWDDILRSIFVAFAAMPFQRILGLIFGFKYRGDETYETKLSFGNQIRDFVYAAIAICAASSIFVILQHSDLLVRILPDFPSGLRMPLICLILAVVDYLFFRYSNAALQLGIFAGFLWNSVQMILMVQFVVLIICLLIVAAQDAVLLSSLGVMAILLLGITILLSIKR